MTMPRPESMQGGAPAQAGRRGEFVAGAGSHALAAPEPEVLPDRQDIQGQYRFMLEFAPAEAIESATAQAFARLDPLDRDQLQEQLELLAPEEEPTRAALTSSRVRLDPVPLARLAIRVERHHPGMLEGILRTMPRGETGPTLWADFVRHFADAEAAREFWAEQRQGQALDDEPDFSAEFGYEPEFRGRIEFEYGEFDRWV